jgi:hypothetical protein
VVSTTEEEGTKQPIHAAKNGTMSSDLCYYGRTLFVSMQPERDARMNILEKGRRNEQGKKYMRTGP